jgi:hypothetical protein
MSANVLEGLKRTPVIRAIVPIGGWASGAAGATAVVVSIGILHHEVANTLC